MQNLFFRSGFKQFVLNFIGWSKMGRSCAAQGIIKLKSHYIAEFLNKVNYKCLKHMHYLSMNDQNHPP